MNIKIKETDELHQTTHYFTTLIQEAAWYSTLTPPNKKKKYMQHPTTYTRTGSRKT
jgi:hypothetical protein